MFQVLSPFAPSAFNMIPLNKQLESLLFKLNSYVCMARAALLTINTSETADQRNVLVFGSITSRREHSGFNCGSLSFDRGVFSIFPARTCRHAKWVVGAQTIA